MGDRLKAAAARVYRLFHSHDWDSRYLDLPRAVWPFRAPYISICWCGATRLRETQPDD